MIARCVRALAPDRSPFPPLTLAGAPSWTRWESIALVGPATAHLVLFVGLALFRVAYPYPFEITEPAAVAEVQGILAGTPLYVAPTLQHVPLIYGPVYFYVSAALAWIVGPSFVALRAVSLAASLGSLALVYAFVKRETANRPCALAAAAVLAAANPLAETALDLGRVDALFTLLLLASAYLIRFGDSLPIPPRTATVLGGVLVSLAGFTKLPLAALPIGAAYAVYLTLTSPRRLPPFLVGGLSCAAVALIALRIQTGPWATWYLWDLPRQHALGRDLLGRFWIVDLLPRFSIPLTLGPLFLVATFSRGYSRPLVFYGGLGVASLGLAWVSRANGGGAQNVLLPAFAVLAVLFGLGLHEALRQSGASGDGTATTTVRRRPLEMYALALALLELVILIYNPRTILPLRSDRWADERLDAALAALPSGPILAPDFAGYPSVDARGEQPSLAAVAELQGGYGGRQSAEGAQWTAAIKDALAQHRFSAIVVDEESTGTPTDGYILAGPLFPEGDDFYNWRTPRTANPVLYLPVGTS